MERGGGHEVPLLATEQLAIDSCWKRWKSVFLKCSRLPYAKAFSTRLRIYVQHTLDLDGFKTKTKRKQNWMGKEGVDLGGVGVKWSKHIIEILKELVKNEGKQSLPTALPHYTLSSCSLCSHSLSWSQSLLLNSVVKFLSLKKFKQKLQGLF